MLLVLFLGARTLFVLVSSYGSFIPEAHYILSCLGSLSYCHVLDKRKISYACEELNQGCLGFIISAPTVVT
jgi:hypothetical protein